jgi:rod shape determining protein RodA
MFEQRHDEIVRLRFGQKLWGVSWFLVVLICAAASVGVGMLYSVADASFDPWASRHAARFGAGLGLMLLIALIDIRHWLRVSYLLYAIALALLVAVEVSGRIGMGAQRWVDLGLFQLQPSELMKIALVLALARYFHSRTQEEAASLVFLVVPVALVLAPVALVLRQPDLGTAVLLMLGAAVIFFMAGVRIWIFVGGFLASLAAIPIGWSFLHEYQKDRIYTFLDPARDPLGAGYHIMQSKIALGSGGIFGKGYLQGTQSHLSFLPEKQTDFIFTTLAEEFGIVGGLLLISVYVLILAYGLLIALRARNQFGRLVALGVTTTFFLYVFINVAMVTGLIPVVGVPLPLVSYGGTAMMTLMIGFGLLMSVQIHREVMIPRKPGQRLGT